MRHPTSTRSTAADTVAAKLRQPIPFRALAVVADGPPLAQLIACALVNHSHRPWPIRGLNTLAAGAGHPTPFHGVSAPATVPPPHGAGQGGTVAAPGPSDPGAGHDRRHRATTPRPVPAPLAHRGDLRPSHPGGHPR